MKEEDKKLIDELNKEKIQDDNDTIDERLIDCLFAVVVILAVILVCCNVF